MTDRKKFKIMYPEDYWDKTKAGKPYLPNNAMVVMNGGGVFFQIDDPNGYDRCIRKLSSILPKYDVIWK
ncbi:MAG: hypothetical protein CMF22_10215 [Idiomarinaceae bacterium]|nr:hypothetical protein [Idiomarinaceae bacterium]MBG23816.1 hypothetical protein [Idiomarinaceae bacterium]|tara:strand:- start:36733 stop:36939 length:207 start_codon:yes stop_codon:yes gene_type:complete